MNLQTIHFVILVGLAIAVGSAMPNRKDYTFPRGIGFYLFDWFYATVKIITFNVMKEAEKKGITISVPPEDVPKIESKENPPNVQ